MRKSSICWILLGSSIAADPPSPWRTNSLILKRNLKRFSYPFDYFGCSTSAYCGRLAQSFAAWALIISPVIIVSVCCTRCCYSNKAASRSGHSPVRDLFVFNSFLSFFISKVSRWSYFVERTFDTIDWLIWWPVSWWNQVIRSFWCAGGCSWLRFRINRRSTSLRALRFFFEVSMIVRISREY